MFSASNVSPMIALTRSARISPSSPGNKDPVAASQLRYGRCRLGINVVELQKVDDEFAYYLVAKLVLISDRLNRVNRLLWRS
jgi:hypothetical protein